MCRHEERMRNFRGLWELSLWWTLFHFILFSKTGNNGACSAFGHVVIWNIEWRKYFMFWHYPSWWLKKHAPTENMFMGYGGEKKITMLIGRRIFQKKILKALRNHTGCPQLVSCLPPDKQTTKKQTRSRYKMCWCIWKQLKHFPNNRICKILVHHFHMEVYFKEEKM